MSLKNLIKGVEKYVKIHQLQAAWIFLMYSLMRVAKTTGVFDKWRMRLKNLIKQWFNLIEVEEYEKIQKLYDEEFFYKEELEKENRRLYNDINKLITERNKFVRGGK